MLSKPSLMSRELFELAAMMWDCSDQCVSDQFPAMCIGICFQTQTGHVSEGGTNMMLECTTLCKLESSRCIIECLFEPPEVKSLQHGNIVTTLTYCHEECKNADDGISCVIFCVNEEQVSYLVACADECEYSELPLLCQFKCTFAFNENPAIEKTYLAALACYCQKALAL